MKFKLVFFILITIFAIGAVSACENSDNLTFENENVALDDACMPEDTGNYVNESSCSLNTKIESKDVTAYYGQNCELVSYLKDDSGQPVSNKKVSISLNSKNYDEVTDNLGKVVLKVNLKPGTYVAAVKFDGDDNYAASISNVAVKVNNAHLSVSAKNFKTYWQSGFYFKAKVTNKVTKNPVGGIKVSFKVYHNKKFRTYYATTDANGVAYLKKNFKVGSYKVITSVKKNKYLKSNRDKSTLTIKPTAETGCASLYVQISNSEAIAGFRRDATNARTLHIVKYKLCGKAAVKQYKKNSYFFHSITTADGWMIGTGGRDNPSINHAIEKLGGKMAKSGNIKKSYLKKIRKYERILTIGHFSIKAPNGKYALVWASGIKTGKLKPGQYLSVPNGKSYFRHGNWDKFSKDPVKAAIKIAATDRFGVNRRDLTAFHWKATTVDGKTNSTLSVYAANDNGHLIGRNTGHLKDNIYCKGKFFSKNKLPKTPSRMLIGVYNFGNIDKLKIQTIVKAPELSKTAGEAKTFNITVKNKKTGLPVKNLKLKIKIDNMTFAVKTDLMGVAIFNTNILDVGDYDVLIYSGNDDYYVSFKSEIKIEE